MSIERTFAMIKPDATRRHLVGQILEMAGAAGLHVRAMKRLRLDDQDASLMYAEHEGKPWLPEQIAYMTSGAVVAIVFEGQDAITRWRALMGPTDHTKAPAGTIRNKFAISYRENSVHGSDSPEAANREIPLFFASSEIA